MSETVNRLDHLDSFSLLKTIEGDLQSALYTNSCSIHAHESERHHWNQKTLVHIEKVS